MSDMKIKAKGNSGETAILSHNFVCFIRFFENDMPGMKGVYLYTKYLNPTTADLPSLFEHYVFFLSNVCKVYFFITL
jgi:hypothetical protein